MDPSARWCPGSAALCTRATRSSPVQRSARFSARRKKCQSGHCPPGTSVPRLFGIHLEMRISDQYGIVSKKGGLLAIAVLLIADRSGRYSPGPVLLCEHHVRRPAPPPWTHHEPAISTLGVSVVAAVCSSSVLSTRRRLWRVAVGVSRPIGCEYGPVSGPCGI